MKINDIRLVHTTSRPGDFPRERLPEIAFLGRSNVGKSSLINSLVGRRKLARISKAPGRTRAIHWYRVSGDGLSCHFVDLPGYGYAKVPRAVREDLWARLISTYLRSSEAVAIALQLLDIRRDGPTELDVQMIEWLRAAPVPHVYVLTKSDKLARGKRARAIHAFAEHLGTTQDAPPIAYSSVTGDGKRQLWSTIDGGVSAAAAATVGTHESEHTVTQR